MNKFSQWVSSISEAGKVLLTRASSNISSKKRTIDELCSQLGTIKGEAMGTAMAYELVKAYQDLDEAGRLAFFELLLKDYSVDHERIIECAGTYRENNDLKNYNALRSAIESPRVRLFRRINIAPQGTETLVKMREHLLSILRDNEHLKPIDNDLRHLLISWFNRGFLTLEQISWNTPAHILEKLIAYEAVHEMDGWDDLRRRLADDRRCFAFFHPALEDEPLIFIEVALVKGMASSVQTLLERNEANVTEETIAEADTAIFYSISNCQEGLKGISFGNFLIKQVVKELNKDAAHIKQFATLSPIPGFRRWLKKELENEESEFVSTEDKDTLKIIQEADWQNDDIQVEAVKPTLTRLCANYLHKAKRGTGPLDPVANFHLGNGAQIARLNWLGDTSANGLRNSAGLLVNYAYELNKVEENHEAFINEGAIATSGDFQKMIKN